MNIKTSLERDAGRCQFCQQRKDNPYNTVMVIKGLFMLIKLCQECLMQINAFNEIDGNIRI